MQFFFILLIITLNPVTDNNKEVSLQEKIKKIENFSPETGKKIPPAPPGEFFPYYRFKLIRVSSISSEVVIIFEFDWNPRWVMIMSVNSSMLVQFAGISVA